MAHPEGLTLSEVVKAEKRMILRLQKVELRFSLSTGSICRFFAEKFCVIALNA